MSIIGDQRGEDHSAGRVHRQLAQVAGRAWSRPMPATSEEVQALALAAGQIGEPILTNLSSVLDVLRSMRELLAESAERDSADNVFRVPLFATIDANGNGVMSYTGQVGFIDQLERVVIQNPGTGTDAYLFYNLPTGFDPTQIGLVPIGQLLDYVSSSNPAAVIDQTSLPVLHSGARLTIVTRGGTAGNRVDALVTVRRTRG